MQKVYDDPEDYSSRNGIEFNWSMKPSEEGLIIRFSTVDWKSSNDLEIKNSYIVTVSCAMKNCQYHGFMKK